MSASNHRRSEVERFLNIETENNTQIQSRIDQARRDLVAPTQKLADAEERCNQCISEVINYCIEDVWLDVR